MASKKKHVPISLKTQVWDKYIGKDKGTAPCYSCEHIEIRQSAFNCGHNIPESKGGQLTVDNLRPICATCNSSMGQMNLEEFKAMYHPRKSSFFFYCYSFLFVVFAVLAFCFYLYSF
jgi:hypothetical protein